MYATAEMLRSVVPEDRVYGRERQLEKFEPLPPITVASSSSGRHVPAMGCKSNPKTLVKFCFIPADGSRGEIPADGSCGRSGEQSGPQQHIASRLGKESVRVAGPGRVRLLLSACLVNI